MYEAVCASVCKDLMCASHGGRTTRGPRILRGVCDWEGNGELGLREYEVEMEDGEKDEL